MTSGATVNIPASMPFSIERGGTTIAHARYHQTSNFVFSIDGVADPSNPGNFHNFYPVGVQPLSAGCEEVEQFYVELENAIGTWYDARAGGIGGSWSCNYEYEHEPISRIHRVHSSTTYFGEAPIKDLSINVASRSFSITALASSPVYTPWQESRGTITVWTMLNTGDIVLRTSVGARHPEFQLTAAANNIASFLARLDVSFDAEAGDRLMIGLADPHHVDLLLRAHTTDASKDGMYVWLNLRTGEVFLRGLYTTTVRDLFYDTMDQIRIPGSATGIYSGFFHNTVAFANIVQRILGAFIVDPNDPTRLIPTLRQGSPTTDSSLRDISAALRITVQDSGIINEVLIAITANLQGEVIYELRSMGIGKRGSTPMFFTLVERAGFWADDNGDHLRGHIEINDLYYHQWLGCVEQVPDFSGSTPVITIYDKTGEVFTQGPRNQAEATTIMQQRHTIENFLHWLHGDPSPFIP